MAYFNTTYCKEQLERWIKASEKVANGQAYTVDNRSLTRADLKYIKDMIVFWEDKYNRAELEETTGSSGCGFVNLIPRG